MEQFDIIVVGAGMAGNAAALKAAQEGRSVLLVDRGKPIGSKNLSGGVLWGNELGNLIPDWWEEMPVERPITRKGVHFLTADADFSIGYENEDFKKPPYKGWAVLRAKTDKWFADKVQEAGGMVVDGMNVERLAMRNDKVIGIEQAGDVIEAKQTIIADGVNSRLSLQLGLHERRKDGRGVIPPHKVALGIKEIIELPKDVIEERFNIRENEGVAHEYVLGWLPGETMGGGFLYTNHDTLCLGVVLRPDSMWNQGVVSHDIMEQFRLHPSFKNLFEDAKIVEYGAHLIPEGGIHHVPQRAGPGWLLAGDAAGFCFSNGMLIQGMNYAIGSGMRAGQAASDAIQAGTPNKAAERYQALLEDSYIWKDFKRFQHVEKVVWNRNFHKKYPALISSIFSELLTQDETPKEKIKDIARAKAKEHGVSPFSLMKDAMTGGKHL